jgi:nucleoside-diphosphate-sugar epimerase
MAYLVTGSSGHLGEALMRSFRESGTPAVGVDIKPGAFTDATGSIADPDFVRAHALNAEVIVNAATLHKPHVATHSRQAFVDTNITGTLNLLEAAHAGQARAFIFTSTTSVFGHAMKPGPDDPAVWVDESVAPIPKNIYGVTKLAAEGLCELFHRLYGLPALVLRTSRFFPEDDDNRAIRDSFDQNNVKTVELAYRRLDIEDAVSAHLCAIDKAEAIGFDRFIISATTPFTREDLVDLNRDAPGVMAHHVDYQAVFEDKGWRMPDKIGRVYDNARARQRLGWAPKLDFAEAVARLERGEPVFSALTDQIGSKGYHDTVFEDGPFPVDHVG